MPFLKPAVEHGFGQMLRSSEHFAPCRMNARLCTHQRVVAPQEKHDIFHQVKRNTMV